MLFFRPHCWIEVNDGERKSCILYIIHICTVTINNVSSSAIFGNPIHCSCKWFFFLNEIVPTYLSYISQINIFLQVCSQSSMLWIIDNMNMKLVHAIYVWTDPRAAGGVRKLPPLRFVRYLRNLKYELVTSYTGYSFKSRSYLRKVWCLQLLRWRHSDIIKFCHFSKWSVSDVIENKSSGKWTLQHLLSSGYI